MTLAALNYAAAATFDDGTCVASVSGVPTLLNSACNPMLEWRAAKGSAPHHTVHMHMHMHTTVLCPGCADPLATNYNAAVTLRDDSVCTYSVTGCTDSLSPSYFIEATIDDASCVFGGCTLTRASMGKEPPMLALRLATLAGGFAWPCGAPSNPPEEAPCRSWPHAALP